MKSLLGTLIAAGLGLAIALPSASLAQSYPAKSIRMIVAYGPGSGADIIARIVADKLSQQMKISFVIDNLSGAGGATGATAAARAPADGYTILLAPTTLTVSPNMISPKPYDPVDDFVAVTKVAVIPLVMVTGQSAPFKTFFEFIDSAKANPGKIVYATSGKGAGTHMEMERIRERFGIDIRDIPYKTIAQAMTDTIGGQVAMYFPAFPSAAPQIKSGHLRALAIGAVQRSKRAPEIPTLAELMKAPGYEASVWYGVVAPKGTPEQIVSRLDSEIQKALASPEVREKIEAGGSEVSVLGREKFGVFIRSEADKWGRLVKQLNLKSTD